MSAKDRRGGARLRPRRGDQPGGQRRLGPGAPAAEQARFAAAHPDLYEGGPAGLRLRIAGGRISLASLGGPGFATDALPDFSAMTPMGGASP